MLRLRPSEPRFRQWQLGKNRLYNFVQWFLGEIAPSDSDAEEDDDEDGDALEVARYEEIRGMLLELFPDPYCPERY